MQATSSKPARVSTSQNQLSMTTIPLWVLHPMDRKALHFEPRLFSIARRRQAGISDKKIHKSRIGLPTFQER